MQVHILTHTHSLIHTLYLSLARARVRTHTHTLSDKFTHFVVSEEQSKEAGEAATKWAAADYHSLDPLLRSLAGIDTRTALSKALHNLFNILSQDGSTLSFVELHTGIKCLPFSPRIYYTIDDWDSMTHNGQHSDDNDCLGVQGFIDKLHHLTRQYLRKRLTTELQRHRYEFTLNQ